MACIGMAFTVMITCVKLYQLPDQFDEFKQETERRFDNMDKHMSRLDGYVHSPYRGEPMSSKGQDQNNNFERNN